MIHCFECGADLPDNLSYCLNCGAKLQSAPETETVISYRKLAEQTIPPGVKPLYIKTFQGESERVKEIAFEQPKFWEYLLTVELLKPKIARIRREYDEILNNLRYGKAIKVSNKDYFNLVQEKMLDVRRILKILQVALKEITEGWGAPGQSGNAIEIKTATDKYLSVCEALVEWEREMDAVEPSEVFQNMKNILRGTTAHIFTQVERMVNEISAVFEQPEPKGRYKIILELELPEGWDEATEREVDRIMEWIQENPEEWLN